MLTSEQVKFIESQKNMQYYEYFAASPKRKNYFKISFAIAIIFHAI